MIDPVTSVRDLGTCIDADLSMRTHLQRNVLLCYALIHYLQQIRQLMPPITFQILVVALVLSRLDYGNDVKLCLPAYLVCRFQSVLNTSALMMFHLRHSNHITDVVAILLWLCVLERIQFKYWCIKFFMGLELRYLDLLVDVSDLQSRLCQH